MNRKLQKQYCLDDEIKKRAYYILLGLLFLPFSFMGQEVIINDVTFTKIPDDLQLVARDTVTNKGSVIIEGQVDFNLTPYNEVQIKVFREGNIYGTLLTQSLFYTNDLAPFNFIISIDAELANYSFEINGIVGGSPTIITNVVDVVAGDVYVIQGQSNGVAVDIVNQEDRMDFSNSANENISNFIRVFERQNVDTSRNQWFVGQGDRNGGVNGNTGQWGLKLAKMLIDFNQIPVAIFNGAVGNMTVSDFLAPVDYETSQESNYGKLYYRLNKTRLKESVKAIFWSQGEKVGDADEYESIFNQIKSSWLIDYPNIKKTYIFQTKNGCSFFAPNDPNSINLHKIKEAQRQLAYKNNDIHIMTTSALKQADESGNQYFDYCHFLFTDGYEEFAKRIFELVQRDFYGGGSSAEIEPPMIMDAYLTNNTTLVIDTDALALLNNSVPISYFTLKNSDGSTSSTSISNITTSENKIIFSLSNYPGESVTISYYGPPAGVQGDFITNSNNLELICFYKYPIDTSRFTVWNGLNWSNNLPDLSKYAIIDGTYSAIDGNIVANNLTINSGKNLDFDNGTINSVLVYGDLTVDGSFTVGDTESLVIKDVNAELNINGTFIKKERTTILKNSYDVTYWSSPVENAIVGAVFPDVDSNRIFYMDPTQENPNYIGQYYRYRHWFNTSPSDSMISGKGFSVDGNTNGTYPNEIMEVDFEGKPNYKDISISINTFSTVIDDADRTNLLGNPYPTAIDADLLIQENTEIFDGTIYLWSHNTEFNNGEYEEADYFAYNELGSNYSEIGSPYYIGSGQGFMILANGSSVFNFRNLMQVENNNNQFYKLENSKLKQENKAGKDRIWLKLTNNNKLSKEILIGFSEKATDGVDFGFDSKLLNNDASLTFYSLIDNNKYTIQGMDMFSEHRIVNLGFYTVEASEFTIGITQKEGVLNEHEILLTDNKLNIKHNLNQSNYIFNQTELGDFPDRFTLKFTSSILGVDDIENENIFNIVNTDGRFIIDTNKIIKELKIYDILGRLLYHDKPNQQGLELKIDKIQNGTILIVQVKLENDAILSKKIILY